MIKKFVLYSFESLYWVASFSREWKEDEEDDVILDIETRAIYRWKSDQTIKCKEKSRSSC